MSEQLRLEGGVTILCAIYTRLSKEDEDKQQPESESIQNQKSLLISYAVERGWDIYHIYCDEDYSGADSLRPDFNKMIEAAKEKKFQIILCKSQSRFTRDMELVEKYIHGLFPIWGIRFIAVADNADTEIKGNKKARQINGLINEWYLEDLSENIRMVFDMKRRQGQYIGGFPVYGYQKDPKNKNHLIIEPEAAEVVRQIFQWALEGHGKQNIAFMLNSRGIVNPTRYKAERGWSCNHPIKNDYGLWNKTTVWRILHNEMYTGVMVQGRTKKVSYKSKTLITMPEEQWFRVEGTHEAIIDKATFEKVQELLLRDTRTSPQGRTVHLFSGFLKCADCGRAITRSVGNNNNVYYACSTYKNRSRTACTMHSIKHNRLEAAVLFAVQQQIHLAVSYSEMIARINTAPVKKSQSIRLEELIAAKERELAKISRYKQSLYQDWKDGEITQQDYRDMKADYERQTIALTDVLTRLNAERAELANGVKSEHPALVAFTKHQNIDQLSRELLVELIDHIKVYENGNISVRFKFADEFRRIAEYIEINTTKPAVAG